MAHFSTLITPVLVLAFLAKLTLAFVEQPADIAGFLFPIPAEPVVPVHDKWYQLKFEQVLIHLSPRPHGVHGHGMS